MESPTPTETAASGIEEIEKCVQFLWNDQEEFARGLVERRKVLSAVLAVIVGLGIFRVDLYRTPTEVAVVGDTMLVVVKGLITVSLLGFGLGGYLLFTHKSTARTFLKWLGRYCREYFWMLLRKARSETLQEAETHTMGKVALPEMTRLRSSSLVIPDHESVTMWVKLDESEARLMRLERQLAAYRELRDRNSRIAFRLRQSIAFLFAGFFFAFWAVVSYLWSL